MGRAGAAGRPTIVAVAALLVLCPISQSAEAAPDSVPDIVPGISEPVERGELVTTELADRRPARKIVDGRIGDWMGRSARLAGSSHFDRGELIHTDFVWDAYGADEGEDIQRWNDFAGLFYEETRTRRVDALLRTLEGQLGVPYPIGADEEYGNDNRELALADMYEVRLAADDETVYVLVRTTNMFTDDQVNVHDLGFLLLADTGPGGGTADTALGLPDDHRFDVVLPVGTGQLGTPPGVEIALNAVGWTNAVEIGVPTALVAPDGTLDLSIVAGRVEGPASFTPLNIAFRHSEPVDIYNDRKQAFALHGGAPDGSSLDDFSSGPIALADLRDGRTQSARPGPGYHERQFVSGENISSENRQNGVIQPYGLFVPSDFDTQHPTPATFWLHYRGGKAHSGATINPRLIHQHAREDPSGIGLSGGPGNIVVTPHARGTSYWYVSHSHQDFFEVFTDVHGLFGNIDPQRRYLSGYSMGGYGTYLMAGLYPDLFAAGYSTSGAVTQGTWTGVMDSPLCELTLEYDGDPANPCYIEANSGDADAQNNYRILDNTLHVPIHIDHGTNDELVLVTGVERMALRLIELGHRVEMQTFPGYEHFTQAALDEWVNGTAYLQRFAAPVNPRRVTYRVVPALTQALNTVRWDGEPFSFDPDGAYWVDGLEARDADTDDPTSSGYVDVTSFAIDEDPHLSLPVAEAASIGHSTPYVLHGLDWIPDPLSTNEVANRFEATLEVASAVSFDATRMNIDPHQPLSATIATDGPATVTMTSFWPGTGSLTCDCGPSFALDWTGTTTTFELTEPGTWTLAATLDPNPVGLPGPDGSIGGDGGEMPATGGGAIPAGLAVLVLAATRGRTRSASGLRRRSQP